MSVLASLACLFVMGAQAPSPSPTVPSTYLLGPEDVINITVLRHAEFSSDFVIPPNGTLDMPFGGTVKATGLTVSQLAVQVTNMLKKRLLKPEVSVSVKALRIKRFYVVGDVKLSGVMDLKPDWGVAEALSASGGLAADVQQKDVQVTIEHADTGKKVVIGLDQALLHQADPKLKLEAGDVIRFEAVQLFPIYIIGRVRTPGMYRLRYDGSGILAALAQAGGPTDDGTIKKVRITHSDQTEEVVDLVPSLIRGDSAKLPTLRPGDTIVVPEQLERIGILGYVMKPGPYPIPDGQSYTLADAVQLAGGTAPRGRVARIALLRMVNGQQNKKIYDLGLFLHKGDTKQNPVLMAGDVIYVPETNHVDSSSIFGAATAAAIIYYNTKQ